MQSLPRHTLSHVMKYEETKKKFLALHNRAKEGKGKMKKEKQKKNKKTLKIMRGDIFASKVIFIFHRSKTN